ncbi:MAG: hypothetical protein ACKN89_14855 [Cyanobium sp.]
MTILSSFEVLAEFLIPKRGVTPPPGAPVLPSSPFIIQAYFAQISLSKLSANNPVTFDLNFEETTGFKQGAGTTNLVAQIVDAQPAPQSGTGW